MMNRSSGILLHITSLPSDYGIGNMGRAAFEFVDFLKKAGQRYWQILPVNPPGYGDSPYQAFSAFAGNPYLIDPEQLVEAGWLEQSVLERVQWGSRADQVDFQAMYQNRLNVLHSAWESFRKAPPADYDQFLSAQRAWLEEYCLFMAVKRHFGDGPWTNWPSDIRLHQPAALRRYRAALADDAAFYAFTQYCFQKQWQRLREYAHAQGISIIGDIPIYVPLDSADVWAHPENFQLTRTRRPRVVAGCPPDGFSANGQYWGNPIYDWKRMEQDGFSWWLARLNAAGEKFDVVRIDHFRGIESYWSIPAQNRTARKGQWVKGPGLRFVRAIQKGCPDVAFIAEDLGFLTPEVLKMVQESGFPGMKVLEFAFDPREPSDYLPHKYGENCICYTGTHDNETLVQWCDSISRESDAYARDYLKITAQDDLPEALIRAGMESNARLFVAQMQDYLRLGAEARMNRPGLVIPQNWRWRMLPGAASDVLAAELLALTKQAGRI